MPERKELARVLKLCSSAMKTGKDEAVSFTSFFFDGTACQTFDDEIAIMVPFETPFKGGVNGRMLNAWVGGCSGNEFEVESPKDRPADLLWKCGRSKLETPLISSDSQVYRRPSDKPLELPVPLNLIEALRIVALAMGDDPAHPKRRGVAIKIAAKSARLWATNNFSCAQTSCVMETDQPLAVGLPPRFVEIVLAAAKTDAVAMLMIGDGWVEAGFESGMTVWSKTIRDPAVPNYEKVVTMNFAAAKSFVPIPKGLVGVLERLVGVMSVADNKIATMTIKDEKIRFEAKAGASVVRDVIRLDQHPDTGECMFSPALLPPAIEHAEEITLIEKRAILLRGPNFMFIQALILAK